MVSSNAIFRCNIYSHGCNSSAEPGHTSGVESQHSQVSLFSGSEAPSSLELFSQPPNQDEIITAGNGSTVSRISTDVSGAMKSNHASIPPQYPTVTIDYIFCAHVS